MNQRRVELGLTIIVFARNVLLVQDANADDLTTIGVSSQPLLLTSVG